MSTNDSTPDPTAGERGVPALLAALQKAIDAAKADRRANSDPDPTEGERLCDVIRPSPLPGFEAQRGCWLPSGHEGNHQWAPVAPDADDASELRWRDPQTGALGPIHDPVCAALSYDDEDSCSCGAPADAASTPASEGLTEALLSVRAKVEGEALLYADEDGTMPLWNADDPDMHAVRDALLPWLAARVADAEAKARADLDSTIAAIERLAAGWEASSRLGHHNAGGFAGALRALLRDRAARIARGDA